MSVLDRSELEQSHLSDLHAIAAELGIEGYRRLGKAGLIDAILAGGGGDDEPAGADDPIEGSSESAASRRRLRRPRLRRGREEDDAPAGGDEAIGDAEAQAETDDEPLTSSNGDDGAEVVLPEGDDGDSSAAEPDRPPRRRRGGSGRGSGSGRSGGPGRSGSGRTPARDDDEADPAEEDEGGEPRNGVLDILPGGSGFMRADAFVHAREDVYVSPAQIRRCDLRAGDEISGPVRPPRRSERYPSLVHVETVNGKSSDAAADRPLFDDLTPTFATEPLETVHGLAFGKGSRVAIGGPPGAGATRLLREVTEALEGDLDVLVVLAGVRPEEVTEWRRTEGLTVAGGGFDRPPDELAQIADMAVERAKRIAERGADAVLVIDGLDALAPPAARRVFGAARNIEEAGSLTIVAATGSGAELQRLATTRVVLSAEGTLDAGASGTLRAELLGA